tara:strand:- start:44 stop:499 length:456 start_codon:yes stop_codon:yes gene_type:complete
MSHTPKEASIIKKVVKALRKASKLHAQQADMLDGIDETSLFEAKGKHAAKRFRMMIRKGIKPDASTARKAAKYNMKNKGMGFDETDAEMRSDEAKGKFASKRYFDNERRGKRSDSKTVRGHKRFQGVRDEKVARGQIVPNDTEYRPDPDHR